MQSGADFYAAKREILSCRIGTGRSCCQHECMVQYFARQYTTQINHLSSNIFSFIFILFPAYRGPTGGAGVALGR